MDHLLAAMESEKRQTASHKNPSRFAKNWRKLGQVEVNDGIEMHDSSDGCVARAELPHVLDVEFEIGIQALGYRDHLRGEVDPKDRDALLTQVPSNVPRPTAEIGDGTPTASLFCKAI